MTPFEETPVITIDGPVGVGKSTLSKRLAETLGWHLLESGKLYRVLALIMAEEDISPEDTDLLFEAVKRPVRFERTPGEELTQVWLEDRNVTDTIMAEECGQMASEASKYEAVRAALVHAQRMQAKLPGLVAEGRDMGTVIFPDAQLKIFLVADAQERALRRYNQLKDLGKHVSIDHLVEEIEERDRRDSERALAPLKAAEDAISVDSTKLTPDEVLGELVRLWKARVQV